MDNDLSTRIKDCMAIARINNEQLAAACGVKPPTSFHWASGKTKKIKAEPLLKAASLFGVTPEWLATGAQPKLPQSGSVSVINQTPAQYVLATKIDPLTTELVYLFGKLSKPHKHEYLGQLRGFVRGLESQAQGPPSEQPTPANNERTGTHDA